MDDNMAKKIRIVEHLKACQQALTAEEVGDFGEAWFHWFWASTHARSAGRRDISDWCNRRCVWCNKQADKGSKNNAD